MFRFFHRGLSPHLQRAHAGRTQAGAGNRRSAGASPLTLGKNVNRAYLSILILVASALDLKAYESGDPPDYNVIFKTADMVVLAHVNEIILPHKLTQQTEVVLKVVRSLKGEFKTGEVIRIFHESGQAITRTQDGMSVTESAFRCPAFPRFSVGEDVKLYAQWDKKMKRYFVPSHRWKVAQTK